MPNWRCGSERQNENVALNTQRKMNNALNAKQKMKGMMAMNVELETNNGSERQNETTALKAKLKKQLCTQK